MIFCCILPNFLNKSAQIKASITNYKIRDIEVDIKKFPRFKIPFLHLKWIESEKEVLKRL